MYEIKYCGKCHCNHNKGIESDYCKKRFFNISLPNKISELRLVFCAEYIRSYIQTDLIKNDTNYISGKNINYLFEKMITPYLPDIVLRDTRKYSKVNNIYFWVSKKLGIYSIYTFEECLEMIINESESRFSSILNSIIFEINNYCAKNEKYLKHKSRVEKLKKLAKKLKNSYGDESGIICCEIMATIIMSEAELKKQEKLQPINQ